MASEAKEATLIDGNAIAASVRDDLKKAVAELKTQHPSVTPKLAVILVGDRKDSATYVRMKTKACEEVGIISDQHLVPADISESKLLELITQLNNDSSVHGILLQLPIPAHLDSNLAIATIHPDKDVDGLHPVNMGKVYAVGMKAPMIPCTPLGCIHLLQRMSVQIEGKRAVVIGRSNLVGKPVAMLLLSLNATVTMCHSKSEDLAGVVKTADIVIAAVGKANVVKGDWIKPGAVVLDVGTNAVDDATKKQGYRLVGDVEFAVAKQFASAISPVPGGVGPMTVAMLLSNTISAFKRALSS